MKIMKIFGIVVGIHVFALVLIFANPGCTSSTKQPPAVADTVQAEPPASVSAPISAAPRSSTVDTTGISPAPISFNPDAPATASVAANTGPRGVPTRPETPVAKVLVAEPVSDVTPAATHTVKSGESLWTIAKKYHLTPAEVAAANSISVNAKIQPGQKLLIPTKSAAPASAKGATKGGSVGNGKSGAASVAGSKAPSTAASTSAPATGEGVVKHTVKSGETLGGIAKQYGVKQSDIAVANNIDNPARLPIGTELIIPGWQPPSTKGGKTASKKASSTTKAAEPAVEAAPVQSAPLPAVPIVPVFENPITPAPRP